MNAPANVVATPDIEARPADSGSWRTDSMCRQHPTDWWFAGGNRDTMLAKRICGACVVRPQCLEFALGRPELLGVWAATTPNERAAMRRAGPPTVAPADCRRGLVDVDLVFEAALERAAEPAPEPDAQPDARPDAQPDAARPARAPTRRGTRAIVGRDELLTPAEAARLLGVTPNTVTRWSRAGKMSAIQTMGGHRRFRHSEVERVLRDANLPASLSI